MNITLDQILSLVGKLDDTPGNETPRERFRHYLKENVKAVGQVRDYVEECLRRTGEQYNRALQDLVNYIGSFIGFEISFGRYHGVQGQIGFDGLWKSPTGFQVVVEVKTTEAYAIKTATLVGYVDQLISEKKIKSWETSLGLYVVGRPNPEIRQLENAIIAEKRTHQLRIISVGSLLSLAEMMNEYDVSHEDILAVLQPSGPSIDSVIDLMAGLVAQRQAEEISVKEALAEEPLPDAETSYWLTPVKSNDKQTGEEVIKSLVGEEKIYAFGERTPGRRHLKPGDWICFYATTNGVIAHAKVLTKPEKKKHPKVRDPETYPWVFRLDSVRVYEDKSIVIDAERRSKLDIFSGRDLNKSWAWLVQATRKITEKDFKILTRSN